MEHKVESGNGRVATEGPSTITIGRVQRYVVRCSGMKGTYYESDEEEAKPKKELWMSMVGEGSR